MPRIDEIIAEVFGYPPTDQSDRARRHREKSLCPFNNKVPNCTKDKAKDPLGVCSIMHEGAPVITCPVRFREDWIIADDAANFFFGEQVRWTSLAEVRLNDEMGKSAGNIDMVLVSYDDAGKVLDFGALEIQAVYISGNVREPFQFYMEEPTGRARADWLAQGNLPRPDYLSSSRKRLVPQLLYKGGILHAWGKKVAVALSRSFFDTLPALPRVAPQDADIAWLIYDLVDDEGENGRFHLVRHEAVFTAFEPSLLRITSPRPGKLEHFMALLQDKLDKRLETPPDTSLIDRPF